MGDLVETFWIFILKNDLMLQNKNNIKKKCQIDGNASRNEFDSQIC